MRNLLFLLLLTVSGYGQAVFDEGVQITGGQTTTSTTSKIISQETNGTLNTINAVNLPVSTATQTAIDAKVGDFINDGATTIAPSMNAVYDALQLKKNATSTAVTSTLTITNNTTSVTISAFTGKIVDNSTVPATITNISFPGAVNVVPLYLRTILYVDNTGALQQYNGASSDLSPLQRVDNLFVGLVVFSSGTVQVIQTTPDIEYATDNRLAILGSYLKNINEGNNIGANGANLQVNKGAGTTWRLGSNFATDRKVPDVTTDAAATPIPAGVNLIGYRNGSGGWTYEAYTGSITPGFWDNGSGTKQTVSNNKYTNHRVYFFNGTNTYVIYLGRTEFSTLDVAETDAKLPPAIVDPATSIASLIGTISVAWNATALNNTSQARFTQGPRMQGGVGGGGVSGSQTMQNTYLNSAIPQITTTAALGAVTIRRGSAADIDNILVGQNGAGTNTFSVTGAGDMTSKNINLSDNPVGSSPSKLRQGMAGNDYWSIYGESSVSDIGRMVFELGDNGTPVSTDGESFEFRYVDTVTPSNNKTVAAIDYNSTILNTPLTVNSNGEINLNGTGGSNSVIKFSGSAIGASTFHLGLGVVGISNSGFSIRDESNTSNRFSISSTGVITNYNLAGSGDRVVSANSNGDYIISAAPTAPTATAGTNTTQIATTAFVQAAVSSGNFTPTAGATVNITSNTPELARWTKVGDVVTVQGSVSTVPTASGGAYISLSLPFSRAASTTKNIGCGTFVAPSSSSYGSAYVQSVSTTESRVYFSAISTNGHNVNYQYTYITTE